MKRAVTLFLIIAVVFAGAFVSCKKKTSDEDLKRKIETNFENKKNIKRQLVKPVIRKQLDVRKLRRALKNKKKDAEKAKKERNPAEKTEKKK